MNMHKLYNILLVTLVLFAIQHTTAQPEYKISAEGFTFGKPVGNNVKLTVFLSASNTGSIEEFTGQLRNIKLISRQDNSGSYILDDYKKVLDNDKELNGYNVFSLSYIVPVGATDLTMILPELYGNLSIPITKENYEQWVAKGSEENANSKSKKADNAWTLFNNFRYGADVGLGYLLSQNGSANMIGVGLDLRFGYRRLLNSKQNIAIIVQGCYSGLFFPGATKLLNFEKLYGIDRNRYQSINFDGESKLSQSFFGAGIGFEFKVRKISPQIMFWYGSVMHSFRYPDYLDSLNNTIIKSNIEVSSGFNSWKIEIGANISNMVSIRYSFLSFKFSTNAEFLNQRFQSHNLSVGLYYDYK